MTSTLVGFGWASRLALHRAAGRGTLLMAFVSTVVVVLIAYVERRTLGGMAPDVTLRNGVFRWIIPLVCAQLVAQSSQRMRLQDSLHALTNVGVNRRAAVLGIEAVSVVLAATLSAALAFLGALFAHGPSTPGALPDALLSGGIGLLVGIAYASLFTFASTFGRKGQGILWALGIDLLLGTTSGSFAWAFPRAHATSLLGGDGLPGLMHYHNYLALAVLSLLFSLMTLRRTEP